MDTAQNIVIAIIMIFIIGVFSALFIFHPETRVVSKMLRCECTEIIEEGESE